MSKQRFALGRDNDGWRVTDTMSGRPAMLAGLPQTGFTDLEDVLDMVDLLNAAELPVEPPLRVTVG